MTTTYRIKRLVLETLFAEQAIVRVAVLPLAGVRLPEELLRVGKPIVLELGLAMAAPIHDLSLDDGGITATLSFNRVPFLCWLPWGAVVAVEETLWAPSKEDLLAQAVAAPAPPRSGLKLVR